MLTIEGIEVGYGAGPVLRDVSLSLEPGEVFCLFGRNGAGKTTLLKAIMGLLPLGKGAVMLADDDLSRLPPHLIPTRGVGYVPQGRRLFADLTVDENLSVGLMARGRGPDVRARMLDLFPPLADRLTQRAGTLSGGEQQMLAIARALCLEPSVMLLDEPTEGLQPSMVEMVGRIVEILRDQGVSVLLVEQRIDAVLRLADRVGFLEHGVLRQTLTAAELEGQRDLLRQYVGVGG